ncbi:MAG: hypothetical protein ACFFCI_16070, partial [Promethearchaeota archaeon]
MNKNIKFEYYPQINEEILQQSINSIETVKNDWDKPFFFDTKSYLDMDQIQQTSKLYITDEIENIIVIGTGGSIQTLLALKHLAKKKIFPITSSRSVELKECLDQTSSEDSIVIPISRNGETLDVNSTIGTFLGKGYKFLGLSSMGTLNKILKQIKCPILDVPDLSGRYAASISNVGIVPAYISGIKVLDFLDGLKKGYDVFSIYENNDALEFSTYLFNLYKRDYNTIFSMPYSKNLEGSIGLWVQGISE